MDSYPTLMLFNFFFPKKMEKVYDLSVGSKFKDLWTDLKEFEPIVPVIFSSR